MMAGIMPLTQYTWSNDSVFELIEMVRERPVLWDNTLEEHRDRVKKHAAWHEIAVHFGLDKLVVEKKMRMMIGQYRRELTRIAGGDTSKWFAFQKLSFLSGVHDPNGGSFPHVNTVHVNSNSSNSMQNHNDMTEERSSIQYDEEDYSEDSMSCQKSFIPPEPSLKRPKLNTKRPQDISTLSTTDTIVKMLCYEKNSRDEFVVYGEYVGNKLRNIPSLQARNTAQYHINNILYKAEMGHFDDLRPRGSKGKKAQRERQTGESNRGTKWDNESVTSLPESTHSLEEHPIESIQIKLEP